MNPEVTSEVRVSVAHEWVTNWAGSERVAREIVTHAKPWQFVTAIADDQLLRSRLGDVDTRTLWTNRLPFAVEHWTRYAPALLAAWAGTRVRGDALVVSSHFAAHAATLRFDGPSLVYYHTPARILWRPDLELYRLPPRLRGVAQKALPAFRAWDRAVAQRPTRLLANSSAVAGRIFEAYGRYAKVLHPPVDVEKWSNVPRRKPEHLVFLGRLVPYKRADIAVEVARRLGLRLLVVGDGPERARLEATAPSNVHFLGSVSDSVLAEVLGGATAMVFPGEEDFGIAPVEAMAAGVPVVALGAGGALDYVKPGINGQLVSSPDLEQFTEAVRTVSAAAWSADTLRRTAQPFSRAAFQAGFARELEHLLRKA